jgi:pyruvate, water dikinase
MINLLGHILWRTTESCRTTTGPTRKKDFAMNESPIPLRFKSCLSALVLLSACSDDNRALVQPRDSGVDASPVDETSHVDARDAARDSEEPASQDAATPGDGASLETDAPDTGGGPATNTDAGASTEPLFCGEYVRVDSDQRGEIPPYERIRDEVALAARQWACLLDEGAKSALDAGRVDAGSLDAGDQSPAATVDEPDYLLELGCLSDFNRMASHTAAGPSVKVIVDRYAPKTAEGEYPVYFINSQRFGLHYDFAADPRYLNVGPSGSLPTVGTLAEFNATEYTSPERRFLLGALTHYSDTDSWVYELAPYDAAGGDLILTAWDLVEKHVWVGGEMKLHTTSDSIATVAQQLPDDVESVPTSELINQSFQALNLAESFGRLRFITATELEDATKYVDFQDIVVLDRVPNDISVTLGIITDDFQTPLAHINVLSQNRGTPNMALKGAFQNEKFRALENQWVRLAVYQDRYELEPVSVEVALTWWDAHKPATVAVPGVDKQTTELRDIEQLVDLRKDSIYAAVKKATVTFGGKAAHYGALAHVEGLPVQKAFAIPVHYYFDFMQRNGFDAQVGAMLADPDFQNSAEVRDARLEELRDAMKQAPMNPVFMAGLRAKLATEYPGQRMRFRSSTNAEDLDGFTGAGLYTSKSGDESGPNPDPKDSFDDAIRKVWASVWFFRAFEERRYRGIAHEDVGMALLVHRSFPDELANGVALTNNPFDKSGAFPAFYINVQRGEESVVLPPPGQTTDAYLHHWDGDGQRIQYLSHSNSPLVGKQETVLTTSQIAELGKALATIRSFFAPAYARGTDWWAMDVEFKFDPSPGQCPLLWIKQARPFGNTTD